MVSSTRLRMPSDMLPNADTIQGDVQSETRSGAFASSCTAIASDDEILTYRPAALLPLAPA